MWWRSANAAFKAGLLGEWPNLPAWHKAWIIATVEEDTLLHNVLSG